MEFVYSRVWIRKVQRVLRVLYQSQFYIDKKKKQLEIVYLLLKLRMTFFFLKNPSIIASHPFFQ